MAWIKSEIVDGPVFLDLPDVLAVTCWLLTSNVIFIITTGIIITSGFGDTEDR